MAGPVVIGVQGGGVPKASLWVQAGPRTQRVPPRPKAGHQWTKAVMLAASSLVPRAKVSRGASRRTCD